LEVHEGSGELNQPLVKRVIRTFALREPEFFQHVVGFEVEPAIEAFEIAQVVGVDIASLKLLDYFRDGAAFFAHESGRIENGGELSGKINQPNAEIDETIRQPRENPVTPRGEAENLSVTLLSKFVCGITITLDKL